MPPSGHAVIFDRFGSLESAGILHGVAWMNYCLVIFIALPLLCLLAVRVQYNRSHQDKTKQLQEIH